MTLLVVFIFALGFAASAQYAGWTIPDGGKEEKSAAKEESKPAKKEQAQSKTDKPAKGGGKSKAADK